MSRILVLLYLCSSGLVLTGSCQKEASPIPSFCAAQPEWGPGDLIAFTNAPGYVIPPETSWPEDTLPGGLWVIRSDGTGLRSLVRMTPDGITFSGWTPKWFPDGRWIAARDNISRIWKVTPDGDSLVLFHQWQRGGFSLSPDARKIAFAANDSDALGPRGVRILDLESGTEKSVFPYGLGPSWSPDGSRLVFYGWLWETNRWTGGIIVVDTTGENPFLYGVRRNEWMESPSFSPDGSKIAFGVYGGRNYGEMWVVNADGSRPRKLTKKLGRFPSWSPDGTKIVYTRVTEYISTGVREFGIPPGAEGIGDLYIINPDGSGEARLTYFYPK